MSFAIKKRSPFKRALVWQIMRMREKGVINLQSIKALPNLGRCDELIKDANGLNMKKVLSLFVILALGLALAILVLIIEKIERIFWKKKPVEHQRHVVMFASRMLNDIMKRDFKEQHHYRKVVQELKTVISKNNLRK